MRGASPTTCIGFRPAKPLAAEACSTFFASARVPGGGGVAVADEVIDVADVEHAVAELAVTAHGTEDALPVAQGAALVLALRAVVRVGDQRSGGEALSWYRAATCVDVCDDVGGDVRAFGEADERELRVRAVRCGLGDEVAGLRVALAHGLVVA